MTGIIPNSSKSDEIHRKHTSPNWFEGQLYGLILNNAGFVLI